MVPQITNYQEFFANAKKAVAETAAVKAEEESLREQEAKLSNDLLSEQKALKDSIELTVKKRMTEVTATYDEEIDKANEELKKVRIRREHDEKAGDHQHKTQKIGVPLSGIMDASDIEFVLLRIGGIQGDERRIGTVAVLVRIVRNDHFQETGGCRRKIVFGKHTV